MKTLQINRVRDLYKYIHNTPTLEYNIIKVLNTSTKLILESHPGGR